MSNVYRATDRILERIVAVKVLAEHLSDDDRFVARFRREALAVAKLIHPNIVQVYDTGVDSGRHFIVMECVEVRSGDSPVSPRRRASASSPAAAKRLDGSDSRATSTASPTDSGTASLYELGWRGCSDCWRTASSASEAPSYGSRPVRNW